MIAATIGLLLLVIAPAYASPPQLFRLKEKATTGAYEELTGLSLGSLSLNRNVLAQRRFSIPTDSGKLLARIGRVTVQEFRSRGRWRKVRTFQGTVTDEKGTRLPVVMSITGEARPRVHLVAHTIKAGYEVQFRSGRHYLIKKDIERFPSCGGPVEVRPAAHFFSAVPRPDEIGIAAGRTIDVAIFYSLNARSQLASDAAMETEAASAITLANTAYTNSQVDLQIRLVYLGVTDAEPSNNYSTNLNLLANSGDGVYDDVPTLRNQFNADIVTLMLTNNPDLCGLAFVIANPSSPGFDQLGYNVVNRLCILNQSYTHELGHNMGALHDPANSGSSVGAFSYSFGHRFVGNSAAQYRTVMGLGTGTRIQHFSNPSVLFDGVATGIEGAADNAQTILNTSEHIANFRLGDLDPTPTPTATPTETPTATPVVNDAKLGKISCKVSKKKKATIKGKITSLSTGQPLAQVPITLLKPLTSATTNSQGVFRFLFKIKKSGKYTVQSGESGAAISGKTSCKVR